MLAVDLDGGKPGGNAALAITCSGRILIFCTVEIQKLARPHIDRANADAHLPTASLIRSKSTSRSSVPFRADVVVITDELARRTPVPRCAARKDAGLADLQCWRALVPFAAIQPNEPHRARPAKRGRSRDHASQKPSKLVTRCAVHSQR